ncbi:hypothetical protein NDU88_007082 [Pleurodeles waltl]|uniref:Uncharacterized protein n=1 Tax=Pleurodeles waltl TaxID=8319 RepID=A0AAV7U1Z4_PLEWA|nr:hypothetical protein NDU88_007082 [Pleurodeles waltl]
MKSCIQYPHRAPSIAFSDSCGVQDMIGVGPNASAAQRTKLAMFTCRVTMGAVMPVEGPLPHERPANWTVATDGGGRSPNVEEDGLSDLRGAPTCLTDGYQGNPRAKSKGQRQVKMTDQLTIMYRDPAGVPADLTTVYPG